MQNKPISRTDAVNRSSAEVEKTVNDIVGVINRKLVNFVEGSRVAVDVGKFESSVSTEAWKKVKMKVIELFQAEGWNISFNSGMQFDECSQFDIS